jgi:hypothetical protein
MGDTRSDDDDEATMMWQNVLDEVASGRPRNLHCPYCEKEVTVTTDEQTRRTRVACKECKRFIEVKLAEVWTPPTTTTVGNPSNKDKGK